MKEEARVIMAGMVAMARGMARNDLTQTIAWQGIVCRYYPASNRASWFNDMSADITRSLTSRQVISLINIELELSASARRRKQGIPPMVVE